MYDIGTKVYVKSVDRVGRVVDRGYQRKPDQRRAFYLVAFVDGSGDYLTTPSDLRNAEGGCCDGCGRWLPHGSFVGGAKGPEGLIFCFVCTRQDEREYRRARWAGELD